MRTSTPIPSVRELSPCTGIVALKVLPKGFGGILPLLNTIRAELGDVFQLSLGRFKPVFVSDPALIRLILLTERDHFSWRPTDDPVTRLLGGGVLITDNGEHDRLRLIMDPSARKGRFISWQDSIWQETDQVLDYLPHGTSRPLLDDMRVIALRIFWRIFAGEDISPYLDRIWRPMLRALKYISPGLWVVTGRTPPLPAIVSHLNEFLLERIRVRRASGQSIGSLLDDLISAGLSDVAIHDQMLTMLIAGHDTSTALLAWVLVLLHQHPDWKSRLQSEIRTALGDDPPRDENVRALPLLNAIIKETLRLYPPIHVGNRNSKQSIQLGDYVLPAGQRVMLSIYLVHRHPEYWEDPDEFRPDRWLESFRPTPFTYIPFGGGPRNCVGGTFAQVEARIVLACILQRFEYRVHGRILPWMNATLEPHTPYWQIENAA